MVDPAQPDSSLGAPHADEKLILLARLGGLASMVLGAAIPLVLAGWWFLSDRATVLAAADLPPVTRPDDWQWLAAGVLALLPAALIAAALFAARYCFRAFADGAWLIRPFVGGLRRLGDLLLLAGLAGLAVPTLIKLLLTLSNPDGMRVLAIELSSSSALMLILGGLIRLLAVMMARAVAIAEDNAAIV